MSRVPSTAVFVLTLALGCTAAAQEDAKSLDADVGKFPWLSHVKGYCWRAELSAGEVDDLQCFRVQFDRLIRVEQQITQIAAPKGTTHADSIYVQDPRSKKLRHIFWASDGSFETSTGWIEGEALVFYLDRETDAAGNASARTVLRKTGTDTYKASRESREGTRWREQFSFTYRRAEPAG